MAVPTELPAIAMSSAEVNNLIAKYCQETGLEHTAMSITHESGLNEVRTGDKLLIDAPLPRGQLIRILQRGLLYIEAEQRWRGVDTTIAPPTLSDPLPLPSTAPPVSREAVKAFNVGPPSPAAESSRRASPPAFLSPPVSRQSRAASVTSTDTQARGKRKERRDSGAGAAAAATAGDDSMEVDTAPVASTSTAQSPTDAPAPKRQRTKTAEVVEAIAAILPTAPLPEPTPSEPPTPASAKAPRPPPAPRAPPTPASIKPTSIRMPSPGGPVGSTLPSPGPSKPRAQIVVKSVIKPAPKPKPPPAAPLGPPAMPESRRSSSPVVTRRVSPVTERKPARPPAAARPKPRPSPSESAPPTPKVKVESVEPPAPSKPRGPSPERYAKPEALTRLRIGTQNIQSCSWNPAVPGMLATGGNDSMLRIYDVPSTPAADDAELAEQVIKKQAATTRNGSLPTVVWNPDGTLIATGCEDGAARVWTPNADLYVVLSLHQDNVFAAKWNTTGSLLLTGSQDRTVCAWEVGSGRVKQQWETHDGGILDIDWYDDESYFASCAGDNTIHIMQLGRSTPVRRLQGHSDEVNRVVFSPDRQLLASCSDDKDVRIWSLVGLFGLAPPADGAEGQHVELTRRGGCVILSGHAEQVHTIAWSPDRSRRIIASGSFDYTARLWDVDTGACLHVLERHTEYVYTLTWRPDGEAFATGSDDQRVCVWSAKTGRLLLEYAHSGPVYECVWHPTRPQLAICGDGAAVLDVSDLP